MRRFVRGERRRVNGTAGRRGRNGARPARRAVDYDPGMQYSVAVRALCEFTARRGDLDLRFTPVPTGQEGVAGHQLVTSRRGPQYETEISLQGEFGQLAVRGRADGYDPLLERLEEIKTHRGDLARQPANHRELHWAQAKVYGWLLCEARGLGEVELALVYL